MGMGKSAADALPELRRKGISASGDKFSMGGQILDAAGIAQALRLQVGLQTSPSLCKCVCACVGGCGAAKAFAIIFTLLK